MFVFLLISSSIKAVMLIWYFILQRYNHHVAPKGKPMLTLCLCTINRWNKHKTHSSFEILFLSNASLSLLLNMYWSCQTLLILYFPLWSLSIYILSIFILSAYCCIQYYIFVVSFLAFTSTNMLHSSTTLFVFFKSSFCLFPCSFLPLSQPTSPLPPSLSLSLFHSLVMRHWSLL